MNSNQIKEFAIAAGADICGIADIGKFEKAPQGYNPKDIFSQCKSVIVYLKQMPVGGIITENPVPYSHTAFKLYEELDSIGMDFCRYFQENNIKSVLIPSDVPYLYWDQENKHGRGILSLKHSAVLAGLGIMGKSTIFINEEMGNMVYIGAVLIDTEIEPDPLVENFNCPPNCNKCLDICSVQAMDGTTVNQKLCRERSFIKAGRDWDLYSCSECRKICIYLTGRIKKTVGQAKL